MYTASVPTFEVYIYLGRRHGYTDELNDLEDIKVLCDKFVECGLCVTIQELEYIYTGGREPGVKIGLINYPRFPSTEDKIMKQAHDLAEMLMKETNQFRCTVVNDSRIYLLENKDMPAEFEDK